MAKQIDIKVKANYKPINSLLGDLSKLNKELDRTGNIGTDTTNPVVRIVSISDPVTIVNK